MDGLRLQMFELDFGIPLQGQGEIPHAYIIMIYLKKVREMLKGLEMFLSSQVLGFSVELGEVLVIFHGKIMEDRRQLQRFISDWRNGGDKVRHDS